MNVPDLDYLVSLAHDRVAVRVELARLWLLFVPTFGALAFLLITFANGTTWKFSLWNSGFMATFLEAGLYPVPDFNKLAICRLFHRLVIVGRGVSDFG